jgi:AcrR family transcriptional regulator
LDVVIDAALAGGIADQSLRAIAQLSGTSHRMLIHHFGSKEELFVEVARGVEARQRAALGALLAGADATSEDLGRRFWEQLRSPALAPQERLFFEIYGQALQGRQWALPLLDGIVEYWISPLADMLQKNGTSGGEARAIARLCVAVSRGLLLDVLATGEDREVDDAPPHFLTMLQRNFLRKTQ